MARFGGGVARGSGGGRGGFKRGPVVVRPGVLKQAVVLTPTMKKKKPSPLSVLPPPSSPSPASYRPLASPRQPQSPSLITRRMSQTNLYRPQSQPPTSPISPRQPPHPTSPILLRQPPPSPMSPRHPHQAITRRSSYAQLPQPVLRKRSESIMGPGIGGGIGGGIGMGSLLMKAMPGGGTINFGERERGGVSLVGGASAGGTVLAAAARIERGLSRSPSP